MDFDYLFQAWFVYKKYQLVVDIKEKTFLQLSSPPSFIVRVLGRSGGGGGGVRDWGREVVDIKYSEAEGTNSWCSNY